MTNLLFIPLLFVKELFKKITLYMIIWDQQNSANFLFLLTFWGITLMFSIFLCFQKSSRRARAPVLTKTLSGLNLQTVSTQASPLLTSKEHEWEG